MKKLILIAMLAALVGCTNSATTMSFPALPADFADCKIVYVTNKDGEGITLARCPNSTTVAAKRVQQGKGTVVKTTITVEDKP